MTDMAREYVGGYGFDGEPELTGEEIVRCRDCAYFDTRKCKSQWPFCLDAFCWWGKRKEGGE